MITKITDTEYRVLSHNPKTPTEYTVLLYPQGATCTCKGYGYRRKCSHIDEVRAALQAQMPQAMQEPVGTHMSTEQYTPAICTTQGCNNILDATHHATGLCVKCTIAQTLRST
jgi:hypothetical protein